VEVAVKVIDAPAQLGLVPAVTEMLLVGVIADPTVIVIALEVAGEPTTSARLEVMMQVTT
jgi:hypothetical protein